MCARHSKDLFAILLLSVAFIKVSATMAYSRTSESRETSQVQILSISDFHGRLDSGKTVDGRPVGSAPVLAAYLKHEREKFEGETFVVHAGDLVGASPPQSALLQDEPSIMFFNAAAGIEYSQTPNDPECRLIGIPGNHEFDEGITEFLRLLNGGNHKEGPFLQDPYNGALFSVICANVTQKNNGEHLFPPYVIRRVKGSRIAFVGAALKETPTMVTPGGISTLEFENEVAAVNRAVEQILRENVRAVVLIIHQGGEQEPYPGWTRDSTGTVKGPIVDIVKTLHEEVDVVIGGHTHKFFNSLLPNAGGKPTLVTQAWSSGTAFGDIELEIDCKTRDIVAKSARIVTTWADSGIGRSPDPDIQKLVTAAGTHVSDLVDRVVCRAAHGITRSRTKAGESALGNLIADAQRQATGSDFAFMNPGGIREDLDSGVVTWSELYSIQPFGNYLVTMKLTGRQVIEVLNQQWHNQPYARILQVSGLTVTWDESRLPANRVLEVRGDSGVPIDSQKTYTVTVNNFLAEGGDGFTVFTLGTEKTVGPGDLEALSDYLKDADGSVSAKIEGRIRYVDEDYTTGVSRDLKEPQK